jgi:transposase
MTFAIPDGLDDAVAATAWNPGLSARLAVQAPARPDGAHPRRHRGSPGPAPVRRLWAGRGQAVRAYQAAQDPDPVPGVLPVPALAVPATTRIAIICDNFSPHLTTAKDARIGTWAKANNAEIAYTPTNSSWLNQIEAQFTALRYFALDGIDHASLKEQASMIRSYIIWRDSHAYDERLRRIVDRTNVAWCGTSV